MVLYNNSDAWMCKIFPSTLEGPAMKWYSKLPAKSTSFFESLPDIFTNTYLVYNDVRKRYEAMFRMAPQS